MNKIREAFESWALTVDLQCLTQPDNELLHLLNTAAQIEKLRAFNKTQGA